MNDPISTAANVEQRAAWRHVLAIGFLLTTLFLASAPGLYGADELELRFHVTDLPGHLAELFAFVAQMVDGS